MRHLFIAVVFAACGSTTPPAAEHTDDAPKAAPAATITGKDWVLLELEGAPVDSAADRRTPRLHFSATDKTVSGQGGCNTFGGPVTINPDGALSFGDLVTTEMACPGLDLEGKVHAALRSVHRYALVGDTLLLSNAEGVVARWVARK